MPWYGRLAIERRDMEAPVAIGVATVAERDQEVIGIAPRCQLMAGPLAGMVLPVMYLEAGGGSTVPASLAIALQDQLALRAPFRVPKQVGVRTLEQDHAQPLASVGPRSLVR